MCDTIFSRRVFERHKNYVRFLQNLLFLRKIPLSINLYMPKIRGYNTKCTLEICKIMRENYEDVCFHWQADLKKSIGLAA